MAFKLFVKGVVSSPNYPGNYPHNLRKTEKIEVQEGLVLALKFTEFHIQSQSTCDFDHLAITEADGTILLKRRCGSFMPPPLVSKSNIVIIHFSTNSNGAQSGWSLSWSALPKGV